MHAALSTTEIFLIAIGIIFTVPYLIWRVGNTDYYAPLVVVQIITGILLGPGILGKVFPDYYAFVFTQPVVQSLNGIAWWAVMVFVWIAGIELDLKKAWTYRRESAITAGLALGDAAAVGQHRGSRHVDVRRLDRSEGDDVAIRSWSRHGVRRYRACRS